MTPETSNVKSSTHADLRPRHPENLLRDASSEQSRATTTERCGGNTTLQYWSSTIIQESPSNLRFLAPNLSHKKSSIPVTSSPTYLSTVKLEGGGHRQDLRGNRARAHVKSTLIVTL